MNSTVFRKRLRQLRAAKGVKQEKMSLDMKMSKNYIYNIEAGFCYPSMVQFFAICEYLDVPPYEFMKFGEGYTTKQEELLEAVAGLGDRELDEVIAFVKDKKK